MISVNIYDKRERQIEVQLCVRTPLHWAARRGFASIVSLLLEYGADKHVQNRKGEIPADVAVNEEITSLLGGSSRDGVTAPTLPFVPNYLAHPNFIYSQPLLSQDESAAKLRKLNPVTPSSEVSDLVATQHLSTVKSRQSTDDVGSSLAVSLEQAVSAVNGTVQCLQSLTERLTVLANCLQECASHVQKKASCKKEPGHPENKDNEDSFILVKLRKQVEDEADEDFVETVVDRTNISYRQLLTKCCKEMGVQEKKVLKLRKLPNTVIRSSQDVGRLQNYDELEIVVSSGN